ncbi:MAG TPA: sigma-70 family RNA polymerase sigma factor [Polyangiaceae bacterium]|nr:sigma-70 family RNA polymerase sigma factor [Polyangiaceae bacterium]
MSSRSFSITGRQPARHPEEGVTDPAQELEAIYDEYFDFVWRSLRRLGVDRSALDDALQDVFLVVHRRLAQFERRSSLKTWLFGICLRVGSDYSRKRRHRTLGSEPPPDLPDVGAPDPLEQAARGEAVAFLDAQLAELDPDKRAVFILAELEDMSCPEIAEAVGANVNTVMSRLKAARAQFEAALKRHRARDRSQWGER